MDRDRKKKNRRMTDWVEIGPCKLVCADCLSVLPELEVGSIDAVITDPPYGIGVKYQTYSDTRDNLHNLVKGISPMLLSARRSLVFCGPTQIQEYPRPRWVVAVVWNTTGSRGFCGFSQWTPILFYGTDVGNGFASRSGILKSDVIRFSGGSGVGFMRREEIEHPCPKPLNMMTSVVLRFTDNTDVVLDPLMGSGTTGVACIQSGRRFIGIEIDQKYFDVACRRIRNAWRNRQGRLF